MTGLFLLPLYVYETYMRLMLLSCLHNSAGSKHSLNCPRDLFYEMGKRLSYLGCETRMDCHVQKGMAPESMILTYLTGSRLVLLGFPCSQSVSRCLKYLFALPTYYYSLREEILSSAIAWSHFSSAGGLVRCVSQYFSAGKHNYASFQQGD
jgi:hypothetical protein